MKPHILLVDDEATIRNSLAELLGLEGYYVTTAENAPIAIKLVGERQFALLIVDLKLPGMDGIEALKEIRKVAPQVKVIILTGHGSVQSAIDAIHLKVDDYVLKQPGSKDLLERVRKVLAVENFKQSDERAGYDLLASETQVFPESKKRLAHESRPDEGVNLLQAPGEGRELPGKVYAFENGITVDLNKHIIQQGDSDQTLTPTETRLMEIFLENYGHVLGHRELVKRLQGYDIKDWEAPEVLRPVISRLRQKLGKFPGGKAWIVSIRGAGYLFEGKFNAKAGDVTQRDKVNDRNDLKSV
jgi:DNA-binding response OmpR family regulator